MATLLFFIIILLGFNCINLYCLDIYCLKCTSGYNYAGISCISQCPTGFLQNEQSCTAIGSRILYSAEFTSKIDCTKPCIGKFCHPEHLPLNDTARQSPITTIDRGLYFAITSKLTSSINWIIAPDFSFFFYIRVLGDGTIFEALLSQSLILRIQATASSLIASTLLYSLGKSQLLNISVAVDDNWSSFIFKHVQSQGYSTLTLGSTTVTLNDHEFRTQSAGIKYYLGSFMDSSFQGFLYKLDFRNSIIKKIFFSALNIMCDYNFFWDGSICIECDAECPSWPWCIRSGCNFCYSKNCNSCSGYDYNKCFSCSSSLIMPGCDLGKNCLSGVSAFDCNACIDGFYLYDGICISAPYITLSRSSPAIDIKFNSFTQYYGDLFQSGSNSNTYGPYNNPDMDDPIPLKDRGLYFNGNGMFLKATSQVGLCHTNTIAFWIYSLNDNMLYQSNMLRIYGGLATMYYLTNTERTYVYWSESQDDSKPFWLFAIIGINFKSGISTMTIYIMSTLYAQSSVDGFALYDSPSFPTIGKESFGSAEPFQGFLYSFTLWQDYGVDVSQQANVCGTMYAPSCLSTCSITQYYNKYQGLCLPCDESCTRGCLLWATCRNCADIKCVYCQDYTSTCTQTDSTPCVATHIYSAGNCCDSNCKTCYGPYGFQCLSCNTGMYLLGTLCVNVCPDFYIIADGMCIKTISSIISLIFDKIQDSYTDAASGLKLSTGLNSSFYPNLTTSDPIPAKNRGYYFLSTSYMITKDVILNYNYTLIFWLKHKKPGIIFSKGSSILDTSMTFKSSAFTFSNFGCVNNTNWMLLTLQFTTNFISTFSYSLTSSLYANPVASGSASNIILQVELSKITLGHSVSSFNGFIYRFDLIDYVPVSASFNYHICSSSILDNCLWDCDIGYFYENSACSLCNATCDQGCIRSDDCNLCDNKICEICSKFTKGCEKCFQGAYIDQKICECLDGYYWDFTAYPPYKKNCMPCDKSCYSCNLGTYYSCNICKGFQLENICLDICPLGYRAVNQQCIPNYTSLALRFTFTAISGVYTDSISGIMALTGANETGYPDLDSSDPIPAQSRGLYFTGQGSYATFPYKSNSTQLLGIRAFISFWISPSANTGTLLLLRSISYSYLEVSLQSSHPQVFVSVESKSYLCVHSSQSALKQWNHLLVYVDYLSISQLSLTLNKVSSAIVTISEAPFIVPSQCLGVIGCNDLNKNYYQGFLYQLEVHTIKPDISILVSSQCSHCSICIKDEPCINNCEINTFIDNQTGNCSQCMNSCKAGCRNSDNCNLCSDRNCRACSGFGDFECIECNIGFTLVQGQCKPCKLGQYYDDKEKTCLLCQDLCKSCMSATGCITCVSNSILNSKSVCVCNMGYHEINSTCVRNLFFVFYELSITADVALLFSEELSTELTKSSLSITLDDISTSFTLVIVDIQRYKIALHLQFPLTQNSIMNISFINPIVSISNSLLSVTSLKITLPYYSLNAITTQIIHLQSYSKQGVTAALSIAIGTSALNLNPNSLFTFLNCVEIYTYTVLFDLNLDSEFAQFLVGLQPGSLFPNIFRYFISDSSGVPLSGKFNDFGYNSNLILINSGLSISIILVVILSIPFIFCLKCLTKGWLKSKIKWIARKYKYAIFLRLFIQLFLELLLSSCIGILNTDLENNLQIVDFIICCLFLATDTFGILLLLLLLRRRSFIENKEEFLKKFGILFYEMNDTKISERLFYIFYVIRRLIIGLAAFFIRVPIVQLSLSMTMSLCVIIRQILVYLICVRPFKSKVTENYLICNEILTTIYFGILATSFIKDTGIDRSSSYVFCIKLILASLTANCLSNIISSLKAIITCIRNRKQVHSGLPERVDTNLTIKNQPDIKPGLKDK